MPKDVMKLRTYLKSLGLKDLRAIAIAAVERLIETEEVGFREQELDCPAYVYWTGSVDDIRE